MKFRKKVPLWRSEALREQHANTLTWLKVQAPDAVLFAESTDEVTVAVAACAAARKASHLSCMSGRSSGASGVASASPFSRWAAAWVAPGAYVLRDRVHVTTAYVPG